jgi:hypothetical protein
MYRQVLILLLLVISGMGELLAQSFPFYTVLRAGRAGNGEWEIGVGNASTLNTANFSYGGNGGQFWNPAGSQTFRIGYDAATNSAYASVFNQNDVATTVSLANTGQALTSNTVWTLPAGAFSVTATPTNVFGFGTSSITVSGLTLSPGGSLLGGSLPTSLSATQSGATVTQTLSSPILLDATGNGGSWYIQGKIQMTGLLTQGGLARDSQLQFLMGASSAAATPEPITFALIGVGLLLLGMRKKWNAGATK